MRSSQQRQHGTVTDIVGRSVAAAPATLVVGLLTAAVSIVAFAHPVLLRALERAPASNGAWVSWRLITSLFVHDGWFALTFNLIGFGIVGAAVERGTGAARWIVLYLVGGMVGELAGIAWQPVGAGNSVASFALAGALVVATLRHRDTRPTLAVAYAAEWVLVYTGLELHGFSGAAVAGVLCGPVGAAVGRARQTAPRAAAAGIATVVFALAVVLCAVHDIHGPPLIAGAILGAIVPG